MILMPLFRLMPASLMPRHVAFRFPAAFFALICRLDFAVFRLV